MKIIESSKSVPADLRAILDEIKTALDARAVIDQAAAANRDAISAGELRLAELEEISAERAAWAAKMEARALADTGLKPEVIKALKVADRAQEDLAAARRALERQIAAVDHLGAEARASDATIEDLKKRRLEALGAFKRQILSGLNVDLIRECASLIPVLQAALAINELYPEGGLARDWLDCAKLISPVGYRSDHLESHVRVRGTNLLESQEPRTELPIGVTRVLQELAAISLALRQHRPYRPPARSRREVERLSLPLTDREHRWNERESRAIEAWSPPKGAGPGVSWEVRQPGGTPAPAEPAPRSSHQGAGARRLPGDLAAGGHGSDGSYEYEWLDASQHERLGLDEESREPIKDMVDELRVAMVKELNILLVRPTP
jgi:hypothetical protein